MIVFICLTGVSLSVIIILGVKFYKLKHPKTELIEEPKIDKIDITDSIAEKV